jgi:hypothetical protein
VVAKRRLESWDQESDLEGEKKNSLTCLFKGSDVVGPPGPESGLGICVLLFPQSLVGGADGRFFRRCFMSVGERRRRLWHEESGQR